MITASDLDGLSRVRNAFFTRRGGVSDGAFASLNCGFGSGDERTRVAANRDRAMQHLGLGGDDLATVYQIHSASVITVESPWDPLNAPRGDALVTGRPGIALGVLTADCAPVLFADADAAVIGAAHCGWKGALAGVMEATVEAMARLGAEAARTVAAVGPCIHRPSYEVGPEFRAAFVDEDPRNVDFFSETERKNHHLFDLPGYVVHRLGRLGLAAVALVGGDTYRDADRFFSYRRAIHSGETEYGRLLSAIALEE